MRIALLAFVFPTTLTAQTLVSTSPQNRTALLEEFTAINCPICPQGHTVAAGLLASHPDDLVLVNLHGGSLAVPGSGQIDFRNQWSTDLWAHYSVNAQPLGLVNRIAYNGQLVMSRTVWGNAVNAQTAQPSPVNIGVGAAFDNGTRDLTVDVELFYTANGTGGNDHVHVLLTESNIIGYQASGGANYSHQHALRSYITPLWGDEVMNNTMGHLEQRTYTFNVPLGWNIANCAVVAFVGEYQGEVFQATELAAADFSTGVNAMADTEVIRSLYPNPANDQMTVTVANATVLEVLDATGRRVLDLGRVGATGSFILAIGVLSPGMYSIGQAGGRYRSFVVAR